MDLVDKKDRLLAAGLAAQLGLLDDTPQFLDIGSDGIELLELGVRDLGDAAGQRRLSRSRRSEKDHRRKTVGLDGLL